MNEYREGFWFSAHPSDSEYLLPLPNAEWDQREEFLERLKKVQSKLHSKNIEDFQPAEFVVT
jgi:hypothetical protein